MTLARSGTALMLVALTSGCFGGPMFLRGEEIHGRVIDDDGAPLSGAAVAVSWLLTGVEGTHVRLLEVAEATTDEHGDFRFASWGPMLRWPLWSWLESAQPNVWIFKPGYEAEHSFNGRWLPHAPHQLPWRQSAHQDVVVTLRRHDSMTPEYIHSLDLFAWLLDGEFFGPFAYRPRVCSWEHIPHLIAAILREMERVSVARPRGTRLDEFESDYASKWANDAKYRGCKPLAEVVGATR